MRGWIAAAALFACIVSACGKDKDKVTGEQVQAPVVTARPDLESKTRSSLPVDFELDNHLRVTLWETAASTNIAMVVLFDVGERNDPPGQSGLAHFVEHLYVTSAAGNAPMRTAQRFFSKYVGANAQTGDDYTVIAMVFPPDQIEAEIINAAARMADLEIVPADVTRERKRLLLEVSNMFGGMPQLAGANHARELLRIRPGNNRRGGLPEHVAALTRAQLESHWRRFYKPANARLVIVGPFESSKTQDLIKRHFGSIAAGEPAPRFETKRGPLGVTKSIAVNSRVPQPVSLLTFGYQTPAVDDELYPHFVQLSARLAMAFPMTSASPSPVRFAPLDDATTITITIPLAGGETEKEAVKRLQADIDQKLAESDARSDVVAKQQYGALLGVGGYPPGMLTGNPYGVAFSMARTRQLGLDPDVLAAAWKEASAEKLARAKQLFSASHRVAVIVNPN